MDVDTFYEHLMSSDPEKKKLAEQVLDDELAEIIANGGINPDFELPEAKGVVRYDSSIHSAEDVKAMTPYMQKQVREAWEQSPDSDRIVIKQTQNFPGDTLQDKRALIEAKHGLRVVK